MDRERTTRLTALLDQAKQAHGKYEATELDGVYDEEWPQWYASYMVDHGLPELLGRDVVADRVGAHLDSAYQDYERADPKPEVSWAEYIAAHWPDEL